MIFLVFEKIFSLTYYSTFQILINWLLKSRTLAKIWYFLPIFKLIVVIVLNLSFVENLSVYFSTHEKFTARDKFMIFSDQIFSSQKIANQANVSNFRDPFTLMNLLFKIFAAQQCSGVLIRMIMRELILLILFIPGYNSPSQLSPKQSA